MHETVDRQAVLRNRTLLPGRTFAGLLLAALVVIATTVIAYRAIGSTQQSARAVARAFDVIERIQALLSTLKDAETGQRGFLLAGDESYLTPYNNAQAAIPAQLLTLHALLRDNPIQAARITSLDTLITRKLDELRDTVTLRRSGDEAGALAIVRTDRGKAAMDSIRNTVLEVQREERMLLGQRQASYETAVDDSFRYTLIGAASLLILISTAALLFARGHRERELRIWLRNGRTGVAEQLLGERALAAMASKVLSFLARHLGVPLATLYAVEDEGRLVRLAGFADRPGTNDSPAEVVPGSGLLGQVAVDNRMLHVRQVPADHAPVRSTLGASSARELLIAPIGVDGEVLAVMEFGFLRPVVDADRELLKRVTDSIAVAIRSSHERAQVDALLAETQQQAEELQTQHEELRVSNEELEEQGSALRLSQASLEEQHAELEAGNAQLEQQARTLEDQADRLLQSQEILKDKALELERSNQYKSEFLANMSHELRTPLNSTLILSKLLADNAGGNLTAEQVKFAETISSAGNDLLTLINDILDLSKLEAGKVDLVVETVSLARTVDGLVRAFEPIAKHKGLAFAATIEAGTPDTIATDGQRLSQILRNLLSNATKFTEAGSVGLRVFGSDGQVSFAVSDSGIGIAPHEQDIIFEAFRQADGTTHRRFGGTGLGLSISRDLARLLGGGLTVQSESGQGSVFTLVLPLASAPADTAPASQAPTPPAPGAVHRRAPAHEPTRRPMGTPDDDRDKLSSSTRLILIIEDDTRFAAILHDLAHEMGFQCIVTHTAGDGLAAAATYKPSAILLDMNLPDHSGLGVLEQLKRNPMTRHIPVHVASVADYRKEARELGAIGYDFKPVKREQLVGVLDGLRARLSQDLRRVLVVEDDARQLDSIRQLLESDGVQIVGAATASEALTRLESTTFDCMVMDLNLPDLSGYDLLEKMSAHEGVPFPPVIVYTGRVLSRDEEQRLGRYSRSIIVKDARSPERLLDEVTLFLHQVESELPPERQRMLREARGRDTALENRRVLLVEDDVRNIFALSSVLEPKGLKLQIARNGREGLDALNASTAPPAAAIDLVLMDIMMPEMDGYTAMREIRKDARWKKLPIIALTAKAMRDDQEQCLAAGANDYISKPLDVEKLLSLVRVWMPK